ncbi:MAG: hypothetical protein ACREXY_19360 [Gammaproteobacteria bacterium]
MRYPLGWCGAEQHRSCWRMVWPFKQKPAKFCGCRVKGCPCAVMNEVMFPLPIEEPA